MWPVDPVELVLAASSSGKDVSLETNLVLRRDISAEHMNIYMCKKYFSLLVVTDNITKTSTTAHV